jgi:hypothetical protein
MTTKEPPLAADRLPSIQAIANYTGDNVRRVRHLIQHGVIPAKKIGGRIESRRSWIDAVYAQPDAATEGCSSVTVPDPTTEAAGYREVVKARRGR